MFKSKASWGRLYKSSTPTARADIQYKLWVQPNPTALVQPLVHVLRNLPNISKCYVSNLITQMVNGLSSTPKP